MGERGLDPDLIEVSRIDTDVEARSRSFPGSPTIRIGGKDVQPPSDNPIGLSCRVYRRRDGSVSPLPDPEDLREALPPARD